MSIYLIMTAIVVCAGLAFCVISRSKEEAETPEDPARGEEKYGGVLPFAATCVAVVLIVAAVCSI